jgi:hypothetical protein
MMHPNELSDAPEQIELVATVSRALDGGERDFFVFRYRMPEGHWAAGKWILGVAGPYGRAGECDANARAFSRATDIDGTLTAVELVSRYQSILCA